MRNNKIKSIGMLLILAFFVVSTSAQAGFTVTTSTTTTTAGSNSNFGAVDLARNPGWERPRPPQCPMIYQPVCGANGVTYSNSCFAGGVVIAYSGVCCADADGDRVCDPEDTCLGNDAWGDEDGDGVCEDIDACLGNDAIGDSDGDGSCDDADLCTGDDRYGDRDQNGICEDIDSCSNANTTDSDGDGICDADDMCILHADVNDADLDGRCDADENCPADYYDDRDFDGQCDRYDICPLDNDDDADGDGFCANVDLCLGFNDTGDTDGDGVCDNLDLCDGNDICGDADADGICDCFTCPADMPAFYDQSTSDEGWTAGGTCIEVGGIAGPPACPQSEWQRHVTDITTIENTYDWTNAIFDAQTGGLQSFNPETDNFLCYDLPALDALALFDDLNSCYQGVNTWMFNYTMVRIDFSWHINVEEAINIYSQRAALLGGSCELSSLVGAPLGFHAEDGGAPWVYWSAQATEDCDFYGCRCDATVTGWTDDLGNWFEDAVTNDSGPLSGTDCTDPRFNF